MPASSWTLHVRRKVNAPQTLRHQNANYPILKLVALPAQVRIIPFKVITQADNLVQTNGEYVLVYKIVTIIPSGLVNCYTHQLTCINDMVKTSKCTKVLLEPITRLL